MLPSQLPPVLKTIAITREAYQPYGNLIAADDALPFKSANFGRAKRFNHLGEIENLRTGAKLNLCIFRCQPAALPLAIKLLEKHPYSTQVFLPMHHSAKFLVLVALGDEAPELDTLKAFIVEGSQGITYHPGVWHYPMTALDGEIDFSCLIWEDDSKGDCEIYNLKETLTVDV
jgi:ureidoglycolate lyase